MQDEMQYAEASKLRRQLEGLLKADIDIMQKEKYSIANPALIAEAYSMNAHLTMLFDVEQAEHFIGKAVQMLRGVQPTMFTRYLSLACCAEVLLDLFEMRAASSPTKQHRARLDRTMMLLLEHAQCFPAVRPRAALLEGRWHELVGDSSAAISCWRDGQMKAAEFGMLVEASMIANIIARNFSRSSVHVSGSGIHRHLDSSESLKAESLTDSDDECEAAWVVDCGTSWSALAPTDARLLEKVFRANRRDRGSAAAVVTKVPLEGNRQFVDLIAMKRVDVDDLSSTCDVRRLGGEGSVEQKLAELARRRAAGAPSASPTRQRTTSTEKHMQRFLRMQGRGRSVRLDSAADVAARFVWYWGAAAATSGPHGSAAKIEWTQFPIGTGRMLSVAQSEGRAVVPIDFDHSVDLETMRRFRIDDYQTALPVKQEPVGVQAASSDDDRFQQGTVRVATAINGQQGAAERRHVNLDKALGVLSVEHRGDAAGSPIQLCGCTRQSAAPDLGAPLSRKEQAASPRWVVLELTAADGSTRTLWCSEAWQSILEFSIRTAEEMEVWERQSWDPRSGEFAAAGFADGDGGDATEPEVIGPPPQPWTWRGEWAVDSMRCYEVCGYPPGSAAFVAGWCYSHSFSPSGSLQTFSARRWSSLVRSRRWRRSLSRSFV